MASVSPLQDPPPPGPSTPTPPPSSKPAPIPTTATPSPVKPEIPTPISATPRPPSSSDVDVVNVPSYSRWFSWNKIHECEVRFLPEFFDGRSPSKNPRVYMYYRNSIVKQFRDNPSSSSSKITFTDVRKTLVGDVGSIRRVFDFLEAWGLINYSPSTLSKPLKWDDKDTKSTTTAPTPTTTQQPQSGGGGGGGGGGSGGSGDTNAPNRDSSKRLCACCKSVCSIACFYCDKYDLTLCARCYVRGKYQVPVNSSDFRRVEISEETRTDWTEREMLQLLEAIMHYGDDWKKVAQHVGGRSEKDCITQFIRLPFGEEFTGYTDSGELNNNFNQIREHGDAECGWENIGSSSPSKRMRLTPLADTSNPIMAQAAFLSALAGADISEAAAQAAVTALTEVEYGPNKSSFGSFARNARQQGADGGVACNGDTNLNVLEKACLDANSLLEKEEQDAERAISRMMEVQMKEILDKIVHFEELDLQMEKQWQQLEQMKNLLFVDQLGLLFHKSSTPKTVERKEEDVRTE